MEAELRLYPCRLGENTFLSERACKQNQDRLHSLEAGKRRPRRLSDKKSHTDTEEILFLVPCRTCPGAVELGRQEPEKIRVMLREQPPRPPARCRHGHELTRENVCREKSGRKRCKQCKREGRRGTDRRSGGDVPLGAG